VFSCRYISHSLLHIFESVNEQNISGNGLDLVEVNFRSVQMCLRTPDSFVLSKRKSQI